MEKGDIINVAFPYNDKMMFQKRPAVVLGRIDKRVLCAPVTTQADSQPWTVKIKNWKTAGLKKPSRVKVNNITTFTVGRHLYIGKLHPGDMRKVEHAFKKVLKLYNAEEVC